MGRITRESFSPDGTLVLSRGTEDTANLWNIQTGEAVVTLQSEHFGPPGGEAHWFGAFSSDGTKVAMGYCWSRPGRALAYGWLFLTDPALRAKPVGIGLWDADQGKTAFSDWTTTLSSCRSSLVQTLKELLPVVWTALFTFGIARTARNSIAFLLTKSRFPQLHFIPTAQPDTACTSGESRIGTRPLLLSSCHQQSPTLSITRRFFMQNSVRTGLNF